MEVSFTKKGIAAIKVLPKLQTFSAGSGLLLIVAPTGRKSWVVRLIKDGKETRKTLGNALEIPLKEARRLAEVEKESFKGTGALTVEKVVDAFLGCKAPSVTPETLKRTCAILHSLPHNILSHPVVKVDRRLMVEGLLTVAKNSSPGVAHRAAQLVAAVWRFAVGRGYVEASCMERIAEVLPKRPPVEHQSAVFGDELGAILRAIETLPTGPRRILSLLVYLFPRVSELLQARWNEIDGNIWTIPAERRKRPKPLRIPLPRQALAILEAQRADCPNVPGGLIFPSRGLPGAKETPYHRSGISTHMAKLSGTRQTLHGLRAVAASKLAEMGYSVDMIEEALGHSAESRRASFAAYQRYDYIEERAAMMQAYADYIDSLK